MSHNVTTHVILGTLLFIVSTIVFDGGGLYSSLLLTTVGVSGTLLGSGTDFAQTSDQLSSFIPIMATIIINIVIYYLAAGVLIFIFEKFKKS